CRYNVSKVLDMAYWGFLGAQIRRIFLDGYDVLVVLETRKVSVTSKLYQVLARNQKEYTFKEADFSRLHLNDIEDMFLLYVQHKLHNLTGDEIVDLVNALRTFTRGIIIQRRVEDVQLRVESYQKKLNNTRPQTTCDGISFKE
ncbi:hypothetical protein Tco_0496925, partial [Tanacetum coccineum]